MRAAAAAWEQAEAESGEAVTAAGCSGAASTLLEGQAVRLGHFVIMAQPTQMCCSYCGWASVITDADVPVQILLSQEAHFGCDPALSSGRQRSGAAARSAKLPSGP